MTLTAYFVWSRRRDMVSPWAFDRTSWPDMLVESSMSVLKTAVDRMGESWRADEDATRGNPRVVERKLKRLSALVARMSGFDNTSWPLSSRACNRSIVTLSKFELVCNVFTRVGLDGAEIQHSAHLLLI